MEIKEVNWRLETMKLNQYNAHLQLTTIKCTKSHSHALVALVEEVGAISLVFRFPVQQDSMTTNQRKRIEVGFKINVWELNYPFLCKFACLAESS